MDAKEITILTAILISAFVIVFIFSFFTVTLVRQQRKTVALHKRNFLAEVEQIEAERARIAHDLHDELGPLLSAVKMKINSFELTDMEDHVQVKKTNQHIDEALKRIRAISFNLMPNSLLRKGLVPAVKEFVDYLNSTNKMKFSFACEKDLEIMPQNSINFYRIIQEVVHNTIKHSGASELKIELKGNRDIVELLMKDNGKGFDYKEESEQNDGFGLRSLLRRTEIMNGKMYIDSEIGSGTTYTFEIPN